MVEWSSFNVNEDFRGGADRQIAASIQAFERACDDLTARAGNDPDPLVNALLDLIGSRCHETGQRRQVGEALFTALNKTGPHGTAIGGARETFVFCRRGDEVTVKVDGQSMTTLPLDDAIRLATLLHGNTLGSGQRAA